MGEKNIIIYKMEGCSDDLLGYMFLFVQDFCDAMVFRGLSKRHRQIFYQWFWKPYRLIYPSHIVHCECDCCSSSDNVKILSLPWYFMNAAPVYKMCTHKECSRTVLRNLLKKAAFKHYKITIGNSFVQSFCSFVHKHIQVDAYASNRCVLYRDKKVYVLLFYGSPLIQLSVMHMRLDNPLIEKFVKKIPLFLEFK
tara:strand:+ start:199 stop:783 length:585 start_codon:yes stop_codon:yes gene_type:complete